MGGDLEVYRSLVNVTEITFLLLRSQETEVDLHKKYKNGEKLQVLSVTHVLIYKFASQDIWNN